MYYELVKLNFVGDYKLEVYFKDGEKGVVDCRKYIDQGGVFSRLIEKDYFQQATIDKEWGVLCWPDDIDIAPETLYQHATGKSLHSSRTD